MWKLTFRKRLNRWIYSCTKLMLLSRANQRWNWLTFAEHAASNLHPLPLCVSPLWRPRGLEKITPASAYFSNNWILAYIVLYPLPYLIYLLSLSQMSFSYLLLCLQFFSYFWHLESTHSFLGKNTPAHKKFIGNFNSKLFHVVFISV